MHTSTRMMWSLRVARRSRKVPRTGGVWKTVRERAKAALIVALDGSRAGQVSISGPARSQCA